MRLYHRLRKATFLARPNRFVAHCLLDGADTICHVKNTGRCKELLVPGSAVWLEEAQQPTRKTGFDLVAVQNRGYVVNMDSQAPNAVFAEWARMGGFLPDLSSLRAEAVYGDSRFDFAYRRDQQSGFVEVKGVTLFDEEDVAFFPDAPTERGVKHVRELAAAVAAGYEATLCFVIQRDHVRALRPNDETHPAFGQALREANASGVRLLACVCHVTPESCTITHTVPVLL